MSALTGFAIPLGVTALICFALMVRAERSRDKRKAEFGGADGGGVTNTDEFGDYFWSRLSSTYSASDNSSYSGSNDSCAGADGGGGDSGGDGGGGGGDGD